MAKKKTRLQMDMAGELPKFEAGQEVTVGGRRATFVSYESPFGPLYAVVSDSMNPKRHVQRHLIREATTI